MLLETVSLENKSVSALNVADDADGIYIYLYTALAVSTTGGIIKLWTKFIFFTGRYSEPCCFRHHVAFQHTDSTIVSHLTQTHPLTHPTTHTPTHRWGCLYKS